MAKITRRMAEEEILKTLNEYNKKIEDAKNYIDYLPLEGKKLVESYEKNVDNRKALLNKVVEDKSFFETLTDEQVYRLLKICEELITKFDLEIKEDNKVLEQKNILDKAIILLEEYGDEKSQKAIREYKNGKRSILFGKLSKNIYGITKNQNSIYTHIITNEFEKDTIENQIQVAVTLAHEFKRNAVSNSINTETRDIVLEDTKIIESFANTYGEEIYKKFPEYGILHYIKKIFGETELKDFADYAFDSTGSYWKVNEAGDLIDDGNTTKVFDKDGKEQPLIHQSDNNGRQGTLEKWLGVNNANTSLMSIAGYVWDDTKGKWIVNPGQIKYDKIKEAHSTGKITDEQFNMIKIAAGLLSKNNDAESEKENIFMKFLKEFYDKNIKNNFINIAFKWLNNKIQESQNNKKNVVKTPKTNQETTYLKQRPLEEKYGYPYTAPDFGSLCLATSIINLYILDEGLSLENVEKFMNDAKGKFLTAKGYVISFENMSKELAKLNESSQYFDYVYYDPATKTYSVTQKTMSKKEFLESDYEYGIGAYIHMDEDPDAEDIEIAHYELVKKNPFTEYNPGINEYKLVTISPVRKYKR
jgi:hypothetical protein